MPGTELYPPPPPNVNLSAVTSGTGAAFDLGYLRNNLAIVAVATGTVTAGAVQLQGSLDGTNWYNLGATVSPASNASASLLTTGPAVYLRANISTAFTGGATVTVTIAGA